MFKFELSRLLLGACTDSALQRGLRYNCSFDVGPN